jgi:NTE family protein
MASRALVLGSGGLTGIAWEAGVLQGLIDRGEPVSGWDRLVGSSAGAYVGSCLLADGSIGPLFEALGATDPAAEDKALRSGAGALVASLIRASRRPGLAWLTRAGVVPLALYALSVNASRDGLGELGLLSAVLRSRQAGAAPTDSVRALGRLARGSRRPERLWVEYWQSHLGPRVEWPEGPLQIVAVDIEDGHRQTFDRTSGIPLARAIAATTAVAGLIPAITFEGRRYMDGGSASQTNADLAAGHDQVVVVAPADRGQLDAELEHLRSTGSDPVVIGPSEAAKAAMGRELGRLDATRIAAAAAAGRADGQAAGPLSDQASSD